MDIKDIPFQVFDLANAAPEEHAGETGRAVWRTVKRGELRIRIVEYSAGYLADHWCEKGHAVYVLEGEFESELKDGRRHTLGPGMCYLVADHAEPHRSYTRNGVKLLIVD
ncbi:MAG TPA: DHCW motif cupin fold protein [Rectinemataceae bacterium]|nr:DHCW motif cupin fold protein [Rectinemataceae bacterium]